MLKGFAILAAMLAALFGFFGWWGNMMTHIANDYMENGYKHDREDSGK